MSNSYVPGLYDLDYYGDWQNVDGYGHCWAPRVDAGWSPYQMGYWYNDYPYGPTWVSSEPWGYAPYHYGRWAFVGDRWYWVPDTIERNAGLFAGAGVVHSVLEERDWLGAAWTRRRLRAALLRHELAALLLDAWTICISACVNLNVPGAVTVVSVDDFTRGIDWRRARKADRNMLASVNPTLDPLLVTPLRNAVVNSAWGRGKKDIPPGIARKLHDTTVITSTTPARAAVPAGPGESRCAWRQFLIARRDRSSRCETNGVDEVRSSRQTSNGSCS